MRNRLDGLARAVRRRAPLIAFVLIALLPPLADAERRERRIDGWRPLHYDVRLWFEDDLSGLRRAEARATVLVLKDSLSVVDFDFGGMPVDGVKLGEEPLRYERAPGRLNVLLPRAARAGEKLEIVVDYHGRPADGLILTKDKDGNPSATGDNWPDRVHHWIPSLDHPAAKASVTFHITADKEYIAVANGTYSAATLYGSSATWTWTETSPIPPYCMVVAVGKFEVREPSQPAFGSPFRAPLSYLVPPSDQTSALKGFSAAPFSLGYFDHLVAPFPYENLKHIVGATRYGGMENASAIVYASTLLDPRPNEPLSARFGIRRGLVEVVAHETAHQWFGDSVSPATWADLWLSEGFATYFAGLFVERYEGEAAFREYMSRAAETYLRYERTRRAPVYDRETEDLNKLLNANNYQKGAWVLHTLRAQFGDAAFFRGIRAYYAAHKNRNATTEDLRAALERASGKDLRAFFARWVYGSGHPIYQASWSWRASRARGGVAILTLSQSQADDPFLTPVPVEIVTAGGQVRRLTVRPTGRETTLRVTLASRPAALKIDPAGSLLKEVLPAPAQH
jgi:aminopeptidase N